MALRMTSVDVVIVGLGAAGGTAALPLAQAGLKVVGLEAGPRVSTKDYPFDEIRNDLRDWMGRFKANKEVPTSRRNASLQATRPLGATGPMMNAVGGTSIHWMTQSWRYLPWNFKVRSETIKRYGAGAIPAGSTVADWPIDYDDARAVVRQGRVPPRGLGQGRERQGHGRQGGQHLRGAAQARLPDPAAAPLGLERPDVPGREGHRHAIPTRARPASARSRTPACRPARTAASAAGPAASSTRRPRPTCTSSPRPRRPGTSTSSRCAGCSRSTSTVTARPPGSRT